jgi:hypothetical protein
MWWPAKLTRKPDPAPRELRAEKVAVLAGKG